MHKIYLKSLIIISLILYTNNLISQGVNLPRISQKASVSQTIGMSEINIEYSRPGVKGRVIWGQLVPYGAVWRAGANENTTINLSHPANINGKKIPAGKYGFHIIPGKEEWILMFNRHHNSWGSFFYDQKADQLRIEVVPKRAEHTEWLTFGFENIEDRSTDVYLRWENLKIVFNIEFDVVSVTIQNLREQLRGVAGFGWQGPMQAAYYCLQKDTNLEEALEWIELSISRDQNFDNLSIKISILQRLGKDEQIQSQISEIKLLLDDASEFQISNFGYFLLSQNQIDEAIDVFSLNCKKYPTSWNTYDSLGEALAIRGNMEEAIKNYEIAMELAPENQKERINTVISKLKN